MTIVQSQSAEYRVHELAPSASLSEAITLHWVEYLYEAIELGIYMLAACAFGTALFYSQSPVISYVGLSRFTWLLVGLMVTIYLIVFSPVSGFSLNPARTISSALFAGVWTAMWLYLSAPLLGMQVEAALDVLTSGAEAVLCAKIYHDLDSPCPFRCRFRQFAQSELSAAGS